MKRIRSALSALCLTALSSLPLPAAAQMIQDVESVVRVSLLDGWRTQSGAHYAGIQISLAPGWKTYWRAPGDGGIPTRVSWRGSSNISSAEILWPRPQVFRQYGMRSVGYTGDIVLPVHLEALKEGPINAELQLIFGVCNEICVPVRVELSEQLDPNDAGGANEIRAALAARPETVDAQLSCHLYRHGDGYRLDVATNLPQLDGRSETSVVELANREIWVSEPEFVRNGPLVSSSVRLVPQGGPAQIDLSTVRLTVLTTREAVELQGCD
jgi:DsbC/DsbD-like thiol-disulfide interchange protein